MTLNFWRMCIANFLLFASAYMLLPLFALAMPERLGISAPQAGMAYLLFVAGMFAVGPFHAYLCDEYRRKGVMLHSVLIMLAAMVGYIFIDSYTGLLLLVLAHGACLGLASTAGITMAIDITPSHRRSAGNKVYACLARLGMLAGIMGCALLCDARDFRTVAYLALASGALCLYFVSRVHVAFRAPIGLGHCSFDRFLLPRAWLPALNVLLMAFVPGLLLPVSHEGNLIVALLSFALLPVVTSPLVKMFVKLSQHCQRGTANTTYCLSVDTGILLGLSVACRIQNVHQLYSVAGTVAVVAFLLFVSITRAYYKKKRVRN